MVRQSNTMTVSTPQRMHASALWGVIVDPNILGQKKVECYQEVSVQQQLPKVTIERFVREHRDLLDGAPYATGSRKSEIIDAIDAPAFTKGRLPDYTTAFLPDALIVIRKIIEAGEKIMVLTSKPADGLGLQLSSCLGRCVDDIRFADKNDPTAFLDLITLQQRLCKFWISHTADELPELIAAKKSGLFHPPGLIYVNRNDSNALIDVKDKGICRYTSDLRDIGYLSISTL